MINDVMCMHCSNLQIYKDISGDMNNPDGKKTILIHSWASVSRNIQNNVLFKDKKAGTHEKGATFQPYQFSYVYNSGYKVTNWSVMVP